MTKSRLFMIGLIVPVILTSDLLTVKATISTESLEHELKQTESLINQKENELSTVQAEIQYIIEDLKKVQDSITINKEKIDTINGRIKRTEQLIEEKKEEILILQDKTSYRFAIMKNRLKALQENDQVDIVIGMVVNSKGIGDFVQRITAINTLIDADNQILEAQEDDLEQLELDKREISQYEGDLKIIQEELLTIQDHLDSQLAQKQEKINLLQSNYKKIFNQISIAEQDKVNIQDKIKVLHEQIKKEQEEAKLRAEAINQMNMNQLPTDRSIQGVEMYVEATAYTAYCEGCSGTTKIGIDLRANPDEKVIAVDPKIIPLGSKVWVEGYGVAIAGDTGGAIKGHKIDVFIKDEAAALQWGRRKILKLIIMT